jgi:phosphoglycerate kinase
MEKKSIRDIDLAGKRVLIRTDFNVPIKDGVIEDDTRIRATLPTIEYARSKGAKVILASHLGRPLKNKKKTEEKGMPFDEGKYSLRPVYEYLKALPSFQRTTEFGKPASGPEQQGGVQMFFSPSSTGPAAEQAADALRAGDVLLLENLRFNAGEEKNDKQFAEELSRLCEVYVNDAFGAAHRAHASTAGITGFVNVAAAGLLMETELNYLTKVLEHPDHPFVAILGGAKISDKIPVIESLIARGVDKLLIGGAMAYTFLKSKGFTVGKSLVEDALIPEAVKIAQMAEDAGVELILPTDHQVVDSYDPLHSRKTIPIEFTNAGLVGLDIGVETVGIFSRALEGAKTIIWNGPMGMFEEKPFDEGTIAIAHAVAHATKNGATSVVGGGDSVAAVNQANLSGQISHISTGGGATLEFLSGKELPGVAALNDR